MKIYKASKLKRDHDNALQLDEVPCLVINDRIHDGYCAENIICVNQDNESLPGMREYKRSKFIIFFTATKEYIDKVFRC